jgi:hypothetical protein
MQTIQSFALNVSLEDAPVQVKVSDGFGSVGEFGYSSEAGSFIRYRKRGRARRKQV